MNGILTRIVTLLLITASAAHAQVPSWQWGKRGGGPGNVLGPEDHVIDIATDRHGNIYVLAADKTGSVTDADGHPGISTYDWVSVVKWSCNGDFLWLKSFGGGASWTAKALRTDTLGGVYITGSVIHSANSAGPGGQAYFDADSTLPYNNRNMFLVKYDTSGTFQWLRMPQPDTVSVNTATYSQFVDMDVSPGGEVYAYGHLSPGAYSNGSYAVTTQSVHVLQFDKDGNFLGGTPMAVTASGGPGLGGDLVNIQNGHFSRDHQSGRYYLCGYFRPDFGTLSFGATTINASTTTFAAPMYLAAFDNSGNPLWVKQGSPDKYSYFNYRCAIDGQGHIYAGGSAEEGDSINGTTLSNTFGANAVPFILSCDSNGNLLWATHGNTSAASIVGALSYANNMIGAAGEYSGTIRWDSLQATSPAGRAYLFLCRINPANGTATGLDSMASNSLNTTVTAITGDRNNNFYVGGSFADQLYPAGATLTNSGGTTDWFVAKSGYANCNCTLPQPNFSYTYSGSYSYMFSYTGSTPYTALSWDFGDGTSPDTSANPQHTFAAAGSYTVCVTATNDCGSNIACQIVTGTNSIAGEASAFLELSVYPNPATQVLVIAHAERGTLLDIYNVTGHCVQHNVLNGALQSVDLSRLPTGLYLARFTDLAGRQDSRRFIKQ